MPRRCGALLAKRAQCKDRTDAVGRQRLTELELEQKAHEREHLGERAYAEDHWFKAKKMPHALTAMSMDAPTETQFDVPVQCRQAQDVVKGLDGKKKWSSKIMGLWVAGWGIRAYVVRDGLGGGANLSCTVLYKGIIALVEAGRPLGAAFHVLLDNTASENKNNEVIIFLAWLVHVGVFEEACAFMMIKGHTYSRIDQAFRTMIVQLRSVAVWTLSSLIQYLFRFLQPYPCIVVEELPHLWDFDAYLSPHVNKKFGGFATGQFGSGMHEIRCRKDKHGVVRVLFRQSSQASTWLPAGAGYPVFDSTPEGEPPIAPGHADSRWNRADVEANIRRWYRYMTVSQGAAAKIQEEWEARFAALPPDGNTQLLAENLRMRWKPPPVRAPGQTTAARAAAVLHLADDYVSPGLENPIVNPITGHGRSAADVARELKSAQRMIRKRAAADMLQAAGQSSGVQVPVFQGDFLLLKIGLQVQLHRVTHGLMIEDATAMDLSFTTCEYAHSPQEGVRGLFGTFAPKVNEPAHSRDELGLKIRILMRLSVLPLLLRLATCTCSGECDVQPIQQKDWHEVRTAQGCGPSQYSAV